MRKASAVVVLLFLFFGTACDDWFEHDCPTDCPEMVVDREGNVLECICNPR